MKDVTILEGDARDIAAIMPIMDSAFDPEFGEAWTSAQCLSLLAVPCTGVLIAEIDGRTAGFALSRWVADEEELLMIGVAPEFQRRGIASKLMICLIHRAKESARRQMFLEVRSNNSARDFYQRHGFEICGVRKGYYKGIHGERFDATTMRLNF